MNKFSRILAYTAIAFAISASPALALQKVQTVYTEIANVTGKSLSSAQVAQAISTCSASRGWKFSRAGSGQLIGKLVVRGKHYVEIGVEYSSTAYKFTYRDSKNMKYNPEKNLIHKRYNSWLENLDNDIRFCLR